MADERTGDGPRPVLLDEGNDGSLDRLLEFVPKPGSRTEADTRIELRVCVLSGREGDDFRIRGRNGVEDIVTVAAHVARDLVAEALEQGQAVLVEMAGRGGGEIVGILMTQRPKSVVLEADSVEIRASRELVLRSGKAALRLSQDGAVDLVGSRISAASRGLFRLVGRALRLN